MLIVSSWLCPKCTFILLHTTLNLKVCKINVEKGGGAGGLQKNIHMTFLVDNRELKIYNAAAQLRAFNTKNIFKENNSYA